MKNEIYDFDNFIQQLKQCVPNMLLERKESSLKNQNALPSPLWEEGISVFRYLMNLSPEDFINIRFHTGLINGDSWVYWHPFPEPNPEEEANKLGYTRMIQDIPENLWVGEAPTPHLPRPLGVNYKGHIINSNIVRFQTCISSLYFSGILSWVTQSKERQIIIEIGGGYGGLAHNLKGILKDHVTYIIIDLPEMFLFQGAFLKVNNPEKSIYIYNPYSFDKLLFSKNIFNYDFILIPNYALEKLAFIENIAIFINMQSFQEMTRSQVQEYLNFAAARVTGCIYSDNLDCHPYNKSLTSISDLLGTYFDLHPSQKMYENIYENRDGFGLYKKYIGLPKGKCCPYVISQDFDEKILKLNAPQSTFKRIIIFLWKKTPKTIQKTISKILNNIMN